MADKKKPFIMVNFRAQDMPKKDKPAKVVVDEDAQQGLETLSAKPKASRKGKK